MASTRCADSLSAVDEPAAASGLHHDALVAALLLTDGRTLGQCWTVSHAFHLAARCITARALEQLDALAHGAVLRVQLAGDGMSSRFHHDASGELQVCMSADDLYWLAQLHPSMLSALLARAPGSFAALAHACCDLATAAVESAQVHASSPRWVGRRADAQGESRQSAPPLLARLAWTDVPRIALACVYFEHASKLSSAREGPGVDSGFADTVLSRLRVQTRLHRSFLEEWVRCHLGVRWAGAGSEAGHLAIGTDCVYLPGASADGGPSEAADAEAPPSSQAGSSRLLLSSRFLAQLFAQGFAPRADRRRSVWLFRRLAGVLISEIHLFFSAFDAAPAIANDEAVEVARRAASDCLCVLCELLACASMRLVLEAREAATAAVARAFTDLLVSAVPLFNALP
ncbi:hypothetical protein T492DRAFT_107057 [Pavlovales sp. CCMP2436]|nr:hypothetical protein T492DRAFT_107057 [Pavlovales sp. CCMP2436]|mmetsp:Transcript_16969/g.43434  ORF Transcript_16969/g.43434 Transcript_16969/m.43434 type:complete len:401 (+) Transcript_16969:500-1702(+)